MNGELDHPEIPPALYAWVGIDTDGDVGIISATNGEQILPAICAHATTLPAIRGLALLRLRQAGKPARLVRFVPVEVMEEIMP